MLSGYYDCDLTSIRLQQKTNMSIFRHVEMRSQKGSRRGVPWRNSVCHGYKNGIHADGSTSACQRWYDPITHFRVQQLPCL